jgi:alkylated DNA repair protein (DNA oxidative demethylase)
MNKVRAMDQLPATFDEVFTLPDESRLELSHQAFVLRALACSRLDATIADLRVLLLKAPFRHMVTPRGDTMSVAMSNCGNLGWITDRRGYRYVSVDPETGERWPAIPASFSDLARAAAGDAGFPGFKPDACLINRYLPGARLSLHQDMNEHDLSAPIVSVSLGMSAVFLFGGHQRNVTPTRVPLFHGDVVVWGGEDRLRFHGVAPIKGPPHPLLGAQRINLTFRKAA